MQIRHLFRHEYPEGVLVTEWDIFCRQHVYDPPVTKMDQLIDTVSEEVIKNYTNEKLIVNISKSSFISHTPCYPHPSPSARVCVLLCVP